MDLETAASDELHDADERADESAAVSTTPRGRRPKRKSQKAVEAAVWDVQAASRMLQLRFFDMKQQFEAARSKQDTGDVWSKLAAALSDEVGRKFLSSQCQSKVKTLKRRWIELKTPTAVDGTVKRAPESDPMFALMEECWGGHDEANEPPLLPSDALQLADQSEQQTDPSSSADTGGDDATELGSRKRRRTSGTDAPGEVMEAVSDGLVELGATLGTAIASASAAPHMERIALLLERQQEMLREHFEETRAQNRAIHSVLASLLERLANH